MIVVIEKQLSERRFITFCKANIYLITAMLLIPCQ